MNRIIFILTASLLAFIGTKAYSQIDLPIDQPKDSIDSLLNEMELIPIMINGNKDNRINIVLMNRWTGREREPYNSPEMREEFVSDINESIIAGLTPGNERAHTAFSNYHKFFNVYGLWYPDSPEWNKGIDGSTVDALRDRLFLPWENDYTGWVTFLVMPNREAGGGGAGRNMEDRIGRALIAGNGLDKMLHEIGHTCISIGDEYAGWQTGTSARPTYSMALEYRRDKIKWRKWIEDSTPLPTPYTKKYIDKIGAFEGGQYHLTHYFRPTAQGCFMGAGIFDNTPNLCPICEQRLAMRVHTLVNPINSFSPSNTTLDINGKTKKHFEIDYITPVPNTYVVRWLLNGKIIAIGVDEVDVEFGALDEYELTCSITDETSFIRPDPPFAAYPTREVTWDITNSNPSSKAGELEVQIKQNSKKEKHVLTPEVSGGTPPYTYLWSDGSDEKTKKGVTPGVYDLTVWDSEFRKATSSHTFYQTFTDADKSQGKRKMKPSNAGIKLIPDITASEKGKDNGIIRLHATGGSAPYTYNWIGVENEYGTTRHYEAEQAEIKIPGHKITGYFNARNNQFLEFDGKEGSVTWDVEVASEGTYPIDFIFGGVKREGPTMKVLVNGQTVDNALEFYATRPQRIGWEAVTVHANLEKGKNRVTLASTGESGVTVDYIRVPDFAEKTNRNAKDLINLAPGNYTVKVTDSKGNSLQETFTVNEVYPFSIDEINLELTETGKIAVADPVDGYTYHWYENDAPVYVKEKYEAAIASGTEFAPPAPGNYYVSARNKLTHAESSNRTGFAVDQKPKQTVEVEENFVRELYRNVKLWFDASDIDGDWRQDENLPPRGPYRDWYAKLPRNNKCKVFTLYEPNKLNGLSVGAFDNVWISRLDEKVCAFQTIVMVYKESSVTLPGKSPFVQLNPYMGRSTDPGKRLFDPEKTHEKTKNGKVFLNGQKIDPFSTPNPMEYCTLTVEFGSKVTDCLTTLEGNFEGEIAELIIFDEPLGDRQRKNVEEYLRQKWFAKFELDF